MTSEAAVAGPAWLRSWVAASVDALALARLEIDALNVFPVPDGDTGTNLYLTMTSAWQALDKASREGATSMASAAAATSRGALIGARGNSGVILAQMLHGAVDEIAQAGDDVAWSTARVARALQRACDEGYRAVGQPMEGTILSVARAAADAAAATVDATAHDAHSVWHVAEAAVDAAHEALARTTDQLEVLRRAGVVDAGGRGLVVVLESLVASLRGLAPDQPRLEVDFEVSAVGPKADYSGPQYEVMFLIEAEDVDGLRGELLHLGDSLVVVGSAGLWNVHVHVDDAGAALEAAMAWGRPTNIRITYLSADMSAAEGVHVGRELVVVTHGAGMARLLDEAGCTVVPAAPRQRPSTGEFLGAIEQVHAREIIVLPSDSDARATAEQAAAEARAAGIRIAVIPTRSIVQTLAAVAVHDARAGFEDTVAVMSAAAGATRYAGITIASKAALTSAGQCREGDVLGVMDGDIVLIGTDVQQVAKNVIDRMLAIGGDLVTLVFGVDLAADARDDLSEWVRRTHPLVDVLRHAGEQPLWPVIVGVE